MKKTLLITSVALIPSFASAQLEIQPRTDNARFEARLEALRSASSASARPSKSSEFQTFEQFKNAVSKAKSQSGMLRTQAVLDSPSRAMIERLGCKLQNQAPSGVERKEGGLNGVMSVYLCESSYLVSYENNYRAPLTQRVIIFDDDYAKKQDRNNPLIKEAVATRGSTRFTSIRWLNFENEIKYEVFADLEKSKDIELEKSLKEGLKEIAINLGSTK